MLKVLRGVACGKAQCGVVRLLLPHPAPMWSTRASSTTVLSTHPITGRNTSLGDPFSWLVFQDGASNSVGHGHDKESDLSETQVSEGPQWTPH